MGKFLQNYLWEYYKIIKEKMKQFNLESYLSNPNQRVVTRDGREVRILCTDLKNKNYAIAYVWKSNNGVEFVGTCAKNGRNYSEDVNDYELDLFFAPVKKERWTIICKSESGIEVSLLLLETKERAENAKNRYPNVIAIAKVEWEE